VPGTAHEPPVEIALAEHLYVIGRGPSYPMALEAALKIKEVSYMHAEGFAGGELKHGVIALIEPGTPCVVLAPNDETFRAAGAAAAAQSRPAADLRGPVEYKRAMVAELTVRSLHRAVERALASNG